MNAAEEREIIKKYEQANDKCGMINILTQLYDCKRADMVELLERNGYQDPRAMQKKKPKPKMVIPELVRKALEDRLEFIDGCIKELEEEYKAIAEFLCSDSQKEVQNG